MRALIRRVLNASVTVREECVGEISNGLLVYVGVSKDDTNDDLIWISKKILGVRIFEDSDQRMNLSMCDLNRDILLVSQFTLYGSLKKGYRPSFNDAANQEVAFLHYEQFLNLMKRSYKGNIQSGQFGENMQIEAVDDGPVNLWLDSKSKNY